ncbi:MAG TPA: bifunctional riboflavin kinase/FAD synthetase [Steroidobacteraceae bacterium]|nr:bifunctional riboflavin kinase/FAD synthetase [Steroidobacteraceae bacterium]
MEYIRGLQGLKDEHRGAAITVGSFDGIHLGHGALIASTCGIARQLAKPAMMLTFEPLPREYLAAQAKPPQEPPARLTDFRERWRVLERSDLHYVCVLRFDERLRQLSGEQFVDLLKTRFGASAVVVGQDFRFGRGGAGSIALLREAAEAGAFELELVPSVCIEDVRVSSSGVRAALAAGDFARARDLLGRAYSMRGRVVQGERLGRRLGYPTANIRMRRRRLPMSGIYAVRVRGVDAQQPQAARTGVASLGFRPTVDGTEPLLEAHVFDFEGSLYGRELEVEFVAKIRDEEKFPSLDALVQQMHRDAARARELSEER